MLTRSATYPDRETAQWATQQVVTANEQAVHRWLAQGTRARLTIEAAWPSRAEPVGRVQLEAELGEFYAIPDTGMPQPEIGNWLMVLADHLKKSIEEGDVPEPASPQTHWEWHTRFPETAQLLGGWFSQDIVDEFPDHAAALADYAATTHPQLVAHLVGELHELLALPLDEGDYALAAAELGMEVGPPEPFSYGAWFQSAATTLSSV
ncbi:contact-dependent growth inhibition system immunity protein [Streptomyces sp. NPDC002476]|uniref:contact-dependent growth inhibition system immunity protein n=1 Tax=Streptomyces sp. NPDC002476 TaxID=3364648 RepID=UPI0036837CD2